MIKTIQTGAFDATGHTSENSLVKLMLNKPSLLSPKLVYLWGKDNDKFPLTFTTLGQGEQGKYEVNDVEYTLKVMGRITHTDEVVFCQYAAGTKPGIGFSPFYIYAKTEKFTEQFGLIAPDGKTKVRIMEKGKKIPGKGVRYTLQLKTTDPKAYCDPALLKVGSTWVMTAPTVSESLSRGNKSNVQGPGSMANQISFQRYTKTIAGNLANKVTEIEFEGTDGQPTNLWISEEMRQFEFTMRQMNEEHNWISEYNRTADGTIVMKDYESGEVIPEGAGVWEQVASQNYDTYGYRLTTEKIKNTIRSVMNGATDDGSMDIVLYGGDGFLEDFDMAIKNDVINSGFTAYMGEKIISGDNGKLSYGAYFTQYKDIKGNTITVRPLNYLNQGSVAEVQKANGILHPRTQLPLMSHTGIFLDQSLYNGERNVRMACMKGQEEITGIYRGLTPIPAEWGSWSALDKGGVIALSTDVDKASFEKKFSTGVAIANTNHCFILQCEL